MPIKTKKNVLARGSQKDYKRGALVYMSPRSNLLSGTATSSRFVQELQQLRGTAAATNNVVPSCIVQEVHSDACCRRRTKRSTASDCIWRQEYLAAPLTLDRPRRSCRPTATRSWSSMSNQQRTVFAGCTGAWVPIGTLHGNTTYDSDVHPTPINLVLRC